MQKNKDRLKFQDFNICPKILHADADADAEASNGDIVIALLNWSAGAEAR